MDQYRTVTYGMQQGTFGKPFFIANVMLRVDN